MMDLTDDADDGMEGLEVETVRTVITTDEQASRCVRPPAAALQLY